MLLYNSQISGNCYKVRLLLAHLGLDYDREDVDVVDRGGRTRPLEDVQDYSDRAELLEDLNPALHVPTLVLDDGRPLAESNAILCYFAVSGSSKSPCLRRFPEATTGIEPV